MTSISRESTLSFRWDIHLELLTDPALSGSRTYRFPGDIPHLFSRDMVINHKLPGTLRGNRPWDGLLLGTFRYQPCASLTTPITGKLVLFDLRGREVTTEVSLPVWRRNLTIRKHPRQVSCAFEPAEEVGVTAQRRSGNNHPKPSPQLARSGESANWSTGPE